MIEDRDYNNKWTLDYPAKRIDPSRVASFVKSGQTIFMSSCCGEPRTLIEALLEAKDLHDVVIVNICAPQVQPLVANKTYAKRFKLKTFFGNQDLKGFIKDGTFDYIPVHLSGIPYLFYEDRVPLDVALIQVSPPDSHGFFSLGISVDCAKAATEKAKLVIAEVNSQMPRTLGNSFVHLSQIDYLIETSRPLPTVDFSAKGSPEVKAIGENVGALIPDRATLATGLGNIIEEVLKGLRKKKDLGFHVGMLSDGIAKLAAMGVVTNRYKTIDQGKIIAAMAIGTKKLYQFVQNNPLVEMHPIEYTHNITTLARIENLISVNSALQVDLYGQVNGEMTDGYHIGGTGGQVDFIRGSKRSRGGKSIICLPSTAKKGSISRIVPFLDNPTPVTSVRSDIDYVVTEYGIAELKGKSLRERALAIVEVASPDFRKDLLKKYTDQWPMDVPRTK